MYKPPGFTVGDFRKPKNLRDQSAKPYKPDPMNETRSPHLPMPTNKYGNSVRKDLDRAILASYKRRG